MWPPCERRVNAMQPPQVLFEGGKMTLYSSPDSVQFEKNWVFWGWLPPERKSGVGRRRVFVYYVLPATIFVACDANGACKKVFEVPWTRGDALAM